MSSIIVQSLGVLWSFLIKDLVSLFIDKHSKTDPSDEYLKETSLKIGYLYRLILIVVAVFLIFSSVAWF